MAEKIKYGNTLVSSRADETLSYTKYIKDEESGKSVKEQFDEEGNRVNAELDKKFDKANVAQELGDSEEKVVSQAALPFRYIQSEEFIFAQVDAEDHLLFGIQLDGTPVFGKKSAVEEGLQSQVKLLAERVATIMGDDDTTNVIDTMNELKQFFANIESTQKLTDILLKLDTVYNNLNTTMDKVEKTVFKDEEGNVLQTPFKVIDSPEFLHVLVDAEDHFLFGIQQDGSVEWAKGIPAPIRAKLQEIVNQYQQGKEDLSTKIDEINASLQAALSTKVDKEEGKSLIDDDVKNCFELIENDEWIHAMVDAENHLLFGIRRDTGKPYFPLNEMYHVEQNDEFFALWLDAEDHILMGIRRDGQIIGEIHAVTALKEVVSSLQSEVDILKETVSTIDSSLQELLSVISIQDNHEFMAVETDAEGRILASTNADGSHYAYNLKSETIPEEFSHIDDPEERMSMVTDADGKVMSYRDKNGTLYENGINAKKIIAKEVLFSSLSEVTTKDDIYIERPKFAEIYLDIEPPATKVDLVMKVSNAEVLHCMADIEIQGHGSTQYNKKGFTFNFLNKKGSALKVKFGNMISTDSLHCKAYITDSTQSRGISCANIWRDMVRMLDYPYSKINNKIYNINAEQSVNEIRHSDAHYCEDGFPVAIYVKEELLGLYSFKLKKTRENYAMDKKDMDNIFLDSLTGVAYIDAPFNAKDWEVKNPKLSGYTEGGEINDAAVLSKINRLFDFLSNIEEKSSEHENYIVLKHWILWIVFSELIDNYDTNGNNENIVTWDGIHWSIIPYDMDLTLGLDAWHGYKILDEKNELSVQATFWVKFKQIYLDEIKSLYTNFRKNGFINTNNLISYFIKQTESIPRCIYEDDYKKWGTIWSNGIPTISQIEIFINNRINYLDSIWLNSLND